MSRSEDDTKKDALLPLDDAFDTYDLKSQDKEARWKKIQEHPGGMDVSPQSHLVLLPFEIAKLAT